MSSDKTAFPDGQLVSRYHLENLLEYNSPRPGMHFGLALVNDVPGWVVSGDEMKQVNDWLGKRELLPGEHYFEFFGDVDVPTWIMESRFGQGGYVPKTAGELLLGEVLTSLPFVHNLSIEHIGEYRNGQGYSVSFRCQNAKSALVIKALSDALTSFSHEFNTVIESVVLVDKPSLNEVIHNCEKKHKAADVIDINRYREER